MKILFLLSVCILSTLVRADLDVRLIVAGCNNDTVCQVELGESIGSCPNDCTVFTPTSTYPFSQPTSPQSISGVVYGSGYIWEYSDIAITYDKDDVILSWKTSRPTQSTISWGLTDDYSSGSVSEIGFVREHVTKITNVIPGKKYFFKLKTHDALDTKGTYVNTFLLKVDTSNIPPINVESFRSFSSTVGIGLRWINPDDDEYTYVRIVRSDKEYPFNFSDGKIVYEGRGQSVVDIDVKDNTQYYYAAFVRNAAQVYSSGVLLTATKYTKGVTPLDSDTGFSYGKQPVDTIQSSREDSLPIESIDFVQNEVKISFTGSNIPVDTNQPLTIRIPKQDWSTMFLTLDSADHVPLYSQLYLVTLNQKTGRLEVRIPSLKTDEPVEYSLQILRNGSFHLLNKGIFNTYTSSEDMEKKRAAETAAKLKEWLLIFPIALLLFVCMLWFSKNKKQENE